MDEEQKSIFKETLFFLGLVAVAGVLYWLGESHGIRWVGWGW